MGMVKIFPVKDYISAMPSILLGDKHYKLAEPLRYRGQTISEGLCP